MVGRVGLDDRRGIAAVGQAQELPVEQFSESVDGGHDQSPAFG
jgi:hypothetical protein